MKWSDKRTDSQDLPGPNCITIMGIRFSKPIRERLALFLRNRGDL